MDLILLDKDLKAVSVIDAYESLIWTDRYDSYGDFELCMPITEEAINLMRTDYYLQRRDSEHLMIIENLSITSDAEMGNKFTITGNSLESILTRRIVWGLMIVKGNLQDAIKSLLDACIIEAEIEHRKIPNFVFEYSTDPYIASLTLNAQYTGDNLYDIIQKVCIERGIGFKITLNANNQFVFKLYSGADRSYNQTNNPYVVFSPKFDNLTNSNYIESVSTMKTIALVGGDGEGTLRTYEDAFNPKYMGTGLFSGMARRELFVDARDISSKDEYGDYIDDSTYRAMLRQRGLENLTENERVISFEGEIETSNMFKYGEDFFNGDVVQIANEYGYEGRVRIIEIVTSEDSSGLSMYPTFKFI